MIGTPTMILVFNIPRLLFLLNCHNPIHSFCIVFVLFLVDEQRFMSKYISELDFSSAESAFSPAHFTDSLELQGNFHELNNTVCWSDNVDHCISYLNKVGIFWPEKSMCEKASSLLSVDVFFRCLFCCSLDYVKFHKQQQRTKLICSYVRCVQRIFRYFQHFASYSFCWGQL